MSGGFWAWVAGPWGTLALSGCELVLGVWLGWAVGVRRGRRLEADDLEREEAMARRTHPVYRRPGPAVYTPPAYAVEAADKFAAIREAGRRAWAIQQERDASVELYPGQALAVATGPPPVDELTDSAYTAGMAARVDRFLEGLFAVPYSAEELWSGTDKIGDQR